MITRKVIDSGKKFACTKEGKSTNITKMKAYDVEGQVGGYGDARTPLTGKQGAELHSWLEDESSYQPPNYNSATDTTQPADPVVARMMFYTRIINLGLSVAMIVVEKLH